MSVRIQNVDKEVYVDDVLQDFPVVIYFTALNQVHINFMRDALLVRGLLSYICKKSLYSVVSGTVHYLQKGNV